MWAHRILSVHRILYRMTHSSHLHSGPSWQTACSGDHPADMDVAPGKILPASDSTPEIFLPGLLVLETGIQGTFLLAHYWQCADTILLSKFYFPIFLLRPQIFCHYNATLKKIMVEFLRLILFYTTT